MAETARTAMQQGIGESEKRLVLQACADICSNVHKVDMGDTGFEPVTSCVSCMRSNQLS